MYIVGNFVFYTCAKINQKVLSNLDNLNILESEICGNISLESYWFSRFDSKKSGYLKFEIKNFKNLFNKNLDIDKLIESVFIKVHKDGISSVEIYFNTSSFKTSSFHGFLDTFSQEYSSVIFDFVYELNLNLEKNSILNLSSNYIFATLLEVNRFKNSNFDKNSLNSDSFLFRVHSFTSDTNNYKDIQKFYSKEKIISKQTVVAIEQNIYNCTIFNSSVLWNSEILDKKEISSLLDMDSHSLKESVIYEKSSKIYTEQLFNIDFEASTIIDSNRLFEMHKINSYFLQKSSLDELNYSENIDSFLLFQREIEDFETQEKLFDKSEKNFLDTHFVVEGNEKSKANKVIQYILLFLTLFTILSIGMDIVEFVEVEFDSSKKLTIDIVSKIEIIFVLVAIIVALFYKTSSYIRKS